jgi:hypothetical protein
LPDLLVLFSVAEIFLTKRYSCDTETLLHSDILLGAVNTFRELGERHLPLWIRA